MYNYIHGRAEFMYDLSKMLILNFLMVIMNGDIQHQLIVKNSYLLISSMPADLFAKTVPIVFVGNHETRVPGGQTHGLFPVRWPVYCTFNVGDVAFITWIAERISLTPQ